MQDNTDHREKPGKNFLSPRHTKLANLYYIKENYEKCIDVCRTILAIYPDYLTAKIILLKSYLKCEYFNEAEALFREISSKISNPVFHEKLRQSIESLASVSNQEKLYFPPSRELKAGFREFLDKVSIQENLFSDFELEKFLNSEAEADSDYQEFLAEYDKFHFQNDKQSEHSRAEESRRIIQGHDDDSVLGKVRIITETLADLYSNQGNLKEAYEAYSFLVRAGSANSKRIEDKMNELERRMVQND